MGHDTNTPTPPDKLGAIRIPPGLAAKTNENSNRKRNTTNRKLSTRRTAEAAEREARAEFDIRDTYKPDGFEAYMNRLLGQQKPSEELKKLPTASLNRLIARLVIYRQTLNNNDERVTKVRRLRALLVQTSFTSPETPPVSPSKMEPLGFGQRETEEVERAPDDTARATNAMHNALMCATLPEFLNAIRNCLRPPILTTREKSYLQQHLERILASKDAMGGREPSPQDARDLLALELMTSGIESPDSLNIRRVPPTHRTPHPTTSLQPKKNQSQETRRVILGQTFQRHTRSVKQKLANWRAFA